LSLQTTQELGTVKKRIYHAHVFQAGQLAFLNFQVLVAHLGDEHREYRLDGKGSVESKMIVILADYFV
jgi:hypothetical protein